MTLRTLHWAGHDWCHSGAGSERKSAARRNIPQSKASDQVHRTCPGSHLLWDRSGSHRADPQGWLRRPQRVQRFPLQHDVPFLSNGTQVLWKNRKACILGQRGRCIIYTKPINTRFTKSTRWLIHSTTGRIRISNKGLIAVEQER